MMSATLVENMEPKRVVIVCDNDEDAFVGSEAYQEALRAYKEAIVDVVAAEHVLRLVEYRIESLCEAKRVVADALAACKRADESGKPEKQAEARAAYERARHDYAALQQLADLDTLEGEEQAARKRLEDASAVKEAAWKAVEEARK
jgi:hypothetical protein